MPEIKKNSAAKSFISNIIGFSYATIINMTLGFFIIPLATRVFDPVEMGKINMFTTLTSFWTLFVLMGIDQAYVRYYAESNDRVTLAKNCLQLTLLSSCISAVIIFSFGGFLSNMIVGEYNFTIILCLVFNVILLVFLRYSELDYRLQQNAKGFTVQTVLMTLFNSVFYVLAAFWNPIAVNAVLVKTIGLLLLFIVYFFIQKTFFTSILASKKENLKRKLFLYSLPLLPASVFGWLNGAVSKIVLSRYWGFDAVGVLGIALTLSGIVALVQAGFNTIWAPYAMQNYKKEQKKIQQVHHYVVLFLTVLVLLIVLSQEAIFLLLGESYRSSQSIFPFLLITHVLYTISETTCIGISISGRTVYQAIVVLATMVVNIGLSFLLIPKFGIVGCAFSIAISNLIMVVLRSFFGQKYYKSVDSFTRTIFSVGLLYVVACLNLLCPSWVIYSFIFPSICLELYIYRSEVKRIFLVGKEFVNDSLHWNQN